MDKERLTWLIYDALGTREVKITYVDGYARFTFRGKTYRTSSILHVEEVNNGLLISTDEAWLIGRLLQLVHHYQK